MFSINKYIYICTVYIVCSYYVPKGNLKPKGQREEDANGPGTSQEVAHSHVGKADEKVKPRSGSGKARHLVVPSSWVIKNNELQKSLKAIENGTISSLRASNRPLARPCRRGNSPRRSCERHRRR